MKTVLSFICFLFACSAQAQYTFLPISDTCGTFGIACGITGSTPKSVLQTIYLVNNHQKDPLIKWLHSNIPENKIHGYVGLYFMQRNGEVLSQTEKEAMALVQKDTAMVGYCRGCLLGREKVSDILQRKRLKNYYNWYIQTNQKSVFIQ